jgi:anti-sigma factor ChrR (cupin superfamily)
MTTLGTRELISYVDANALDWEETSYGTKRKVLFSDPETGEKTLLIRWEAGYQYPKVDHHHNGEYLYILEGTFVDHNRACGPGTYVHNRPGSEHQPSAPDGCTFLVFITGKREDG